MSGKLKTLTLGCKLNQYETQYIREGLELVGDHEVPREEPAELCASSTPAPSQTKGIPRAVKPFAS